MNNFICDKCGHESSEEFPDPRIANRMICFKCYEDQFYAKELVEGTVWCSSKLPTMKHFLWLYQQRTIGCPEITVEYLEGKCHQCATCLYEFLTGNKIEAKIKRGMWLGPDVRPDHEETPFQHHSWIKLKVPDNGIIFYADPVQWVFTGGPKEIAISTEDDWRYDPGSHNMRKIYRGKRMPRRRGKVFASGLSLGARKMISLEVGRRDWRRWCLEEIFEIANRDPVDYGQYAKEIFEAIIARGHRATIPFTTREEVFNEGHHP